MTRLRRMLRPKQRARVATSTPGRLTIALALALAFATSGCTAANPDYLSDGGGGEDGGRDGGRPPDLLGVCAGRACISPAAAAECKAGALVADRFCPTGSTCVAGYCQPPAMVAGETVGDLCASETLCTGGQTMSQWSCAPFIQSGRPVGYCAHQVGTGGAGAPCSGGSDCRTGYCLDGTRTCFRYCLGNGDCPPRNGVKQVCKTVALRVEGAAVMLPSCVPQ